MSDPSTHPAPESLEGKLETDKRRCAELEAENAKMMEELASLKTTVTPWWRGASERRPTPDEPLEEIGRRLGHEGASRSRPTKIDATVELDQSVCPRCGGVLSEKPTDSYTRVVEDIVPAKAWSPSTW